MSLMEILGQANWYGAQPATPADIEALAASCGGSLPSEYVRFLLFSNGGETTLPRSYLMLWSTDEVAELNKLYDIGRQLPEALAIGTDGGPGVIVYTAPMQSSELAVIPFGDMEFTRATAIFPSLQAAVTAWSKAPPGDESLSWADDVDVHLVRMPANGLAGLNAIRHALNLDVGLAELRTLATTLPVCLQRKVHHGRTKQQLQALGNTSNDIVIVKHGSSL